MLVYVIQAWFYCLNFFCLFLHCLFRVSPRLWVRSWSPSWLEGVRPVLRWWIRSILSGQPCHVVCRLGRRRARLSTRHCAAVHVLQMGYATWPVRVEWSADCLAWGYRTIAQWATKMFQNRKNNSIAQIICLATPPITHQFTQLLYRFVLQSKCQCLPAPRARQSSLAVIEKWFGCGILSLIFWTTMK